jgi:tartrate-resistant acid phosphatase type 5
MQEVGNHRKYAAMPGFAPAPRVPLLLFVALAWGLAGILSTAAAQFAVIGDFGATDAHTLEVAEMVKTKLQPQFIVTVGDNNYGGPDDIDRNIGKYYHEFIGNYIGEYGPGSETQRFFPAIGNHDFYGDQGYDPHLNYFTLPGNGRYYEVIKGPVHLFIVNSDEHEPDGVSSGSDQANWLSSRLAASTAPWKLVVFHHAPFSSSAPTPRMNWPFREWGADAVLAGHAHNYERIHRDGMPYFVNGLGGHSIVPFDSWIEGSAVQYDANYGAMRVTAAEVRITFEFYSIAGGGTRIDSFSLEKGTAAPAVSVRFDPVDNQIAISWPSGLNVELEESSSLKTPHWSSTTTATPIERDGRNKVILPPTAKKKFYRLRQQ